jgi:hypothetical protein
MRENAICQHTLPYYHSYIRSKEGFSCARGRAAAAAKVEAGLEAAVKETGLSGIDGGGGDQWSRERLSRERL